MTDRNALVASLPTGPRSPVAGTPQRRPGSVRRTTSIDEGWDDFGRPRHLRAAGRDLLTRRDGTVAVLDSAAVELLVDGTGRVAEVTTDPPLPRLDGLVGAEVRSGFRACVAGLVPDHHVRHSVLAQLLDDVPLIAIVSSYGLTREHPEWNIPPEAAERLRDLCAGWEDGATMIGALDRTGTFPIPVGPPAPDLLDGTDPEAWHDPGARRRRSVRRVRRSDLWPEESGLRLQVYFRDSHLGADGPEDVLHEYTLDAELVPGSEGGSARFASVAVTAHTLPWPECPAATASAQRLLGRTTSEVDDLVRGSFVGTSTCTHLNDLLRSTRGVDGLAGALA